MEAELLLTFSVQQSRPEACVLGVCLFVHLFDKWVLGEGVGERPAGAVRPSACVSLWTQVVVKIHFQPWLMWLSGLSSGLPDKGLPVQFPAGAYAGVVGQVPSRGACVRQPHIDASPPLFLLPSLLSKNK